MFIDDPKDCPECHSPMFYESCVICEIAQLRRELEEVRTESNNWKWLLEQEAIHSIAERKRADELQKEVEKLKVYEGVVHKAFLEGPADIRVVQMAYDIAKEKSNVESEKKRADNAMECAEIMKKKLDEAEQRADELQRQHENMVYVANEETKRADLNERALEIAVMELKIRTTPTVWEWTTGRFIKLAQESK